MKIRGAGTRLLIGLVVFLVASCSAGPRYTVTRVIDGDTIEVTDSGGIRTRIRLRRVNAPELNEPGGVEAKAALEARLLGERVQVQPYARDAYGRTVAEVAAE